MGACCRHAEPAHTHGQCPARAGHVPPGAQQEQHSGTVQGDATFAELCEKQELGLPSV